MAEHSSSTSISAAAQAYQQAMAQQTSSPLTSNPATNIDTVMSDGATDSLDIANGFSVAAVIAPSIVNAPSPIPPRTSTPVQKANGNDATSRAASLHPETGSAMPTEAPPHGAPTRQYLNSKVTATLLEGMKQLAKDQPKDPLRVLGEFLIQRSKDIEGL